MKRTSGTAKYSTWLGLIAPLSTLGFVALFIFLSGFGPVDDSELAGTYTANYKVATETLTLLPDGRYIQTGTLKYNLQVLIANGTWRHEKDGWGVVLEGSFLIRTPDGSGLEKCEPGGGRYPVFRAWWKIWIGGDESDGAIQYVKN